MDKKSKLFFSIFFFIAFAAIAGAFLKFFLFKDYLIRTEIECDPGLEKCFVYVCDPESESECSEDPDEQVSYYKLIEKKAYALPACDASDPDCPAPTCAYGEDCNEILCDEATKSEEEQCSDPAEYVANEAESGDVRQVCTQDAAADCDGENAIIDGQDEQQDVQDDAEADSAQAAQGGE